MSDRRDRTDRTDEELADLLSDLEATLDELRRELGPGAGRGPSRFPRPPTPGELLRFTEEYTIPTLVAALEATVRSLELLQRVLRYADPERSAGADSVRPSAGRAGRDAATQLEAALSELRAALSEADLPDEPAASDIVEDARELSAEIRRRLDESRQGRPTRARRDEFDIPVSDGTGANDEPPADAADEDDASVDVESELRSIKDELRDDRRDDDAEP